MIKKEYLIKRNTNTAAHIIKSTGTIGPTTTPIFVLVFSSCLHVLSMVSMNKFHDSHCYILQCRIHEELGFYFVLCVLVFGLNTGTYGISES